MKSNQDVNLFYAHGALFAFSEIIFILSLPVYLYTQGFSLSFILFFHGFASLLGYLFTANAVSFMQRTSIKGVLILGVLLYVTFGFVAQFISTQNLWWILALVLLSLNGLFYYPAKLISFAELLSKESVGRQTSRLNAMALAARVVGPIVGGWVVLATSLNFVFIFGAGFMVLSVIPVLLIKQKIKVDFNRADYVRSKKTHDVFTKTKWAYISEGANNILSYLIWPLFFFLLLANESYFELGSLMTVTMGISVIIMLIVGHLFDLKHRKKLLSTTIFGQAIATMLRFSLLFVNPVLFVYAVQSYYSFAESALQSTFDSYLYSYGKVTSTTHFIIHREINFSLGRFLLCTILASIAYFVPSVQQLWYIFLLNIPILFAYSKKRHVDHYIEA